MPDLAETTNLAGTETEETPSDEVDEREIVGTDADAGQGSGAEVISDDAEKREGPVDETVADPQAADILEADTVELEPVAVAETAAAEAETPVETTVDEADVTGPEDEVEVETPKVGSPYDLPGDWYVIHSYSGYENKVKANLETRIQSMHMEDRIFEVHIPMEDVVEFKAGKKVTVPRKVFPGYILVRMTLDDDSWYAVRNTPGVTGFVAGNAQKPTPLSRREVERFLGVQEEEEKAKPRFKPEWEVGEQVRVVTGPFADFNGVIEDMNVDQQKVTVLVNIFGRDTPVELGFEDIQKN